MATANLEVWLRDRDYDVDKIPNDLWDRMVSELDTLESDCLVEESERNCFEIKMMFHKELKEFSKNK